MAVVLFATQITAAPVLYQSGYRVGSFTYDVYFEYKHMSGAVSRSSARSSARGTTFGGVTGQLAAVRTQDMLNFIRDSVLPTGGVDAFAWLDGDKNSSSPTGWSYSQASGGGNLNPNSPRIEPWSMGTGKTAVNLVRYQGATYISANIPSNSVNGTIYQYYTNAQVVPVPAASVLMTSGLFGLALFARRRKNKTKA